MHGQNDALKDKLLAALHDFAAQRPGLEFGNYGDYKSYRAEIRSITKDLHDARTLLRAVEYSSISGEALLSAFCAYSGRLSVTFDHSKCSDEKQRTCGPCVQGTSGQFERWEHISDEPYCAGYTPCRTGRVVLDYCTGQYWPTEYRRAVCAVAAGALWEHRREDYLTGYKRTAKVTTDAKGFKRYNGLSPGDIIRRSFQREFGNGIANRWFN